MDAQVSELVEQAQRSLVRTPNRFLDALEAGTVSRDRLRILAGELYWLVSSDRQSSALLAERFPTSPLFQGMAGGEEEALRLLLDFARAIGMTEADLRAYEPWPSAQAYPAYLAQIAAFGQRSALPLALLVNVEESGGYYTRAANALVSRYGYTELEVAHFRFFADTPEDVLKLAADVVAVGLSEGDDPAMSVRAARMVNAYEAMFWSTLAG
jgi:thiaminase